MNQSRSFKEVARKRPWEHGRFSNDYENDFLPCSATNASHRLVLAFMMQKRGHGPTFSAMLLNSDTLDQAVNQPHNLQFPSLVQLNRYLDAIKFLTEDVHLQRGAKVFSGSFNATPLDDWYRGAVKTLQQIVVSGLNNTTFSERQLFVLEIL